MSLRPEGARNPEGDSSRYDEFSIDELEVEIHASNNVRILGQILEVLKKREQDKRVEDLIEPTKDKIDRIALDVLTRIAVKPPGKNSFDASETFFEASFNAEDDPQLARDEAAREQAVRERLSKSDD